MTASPLVTAIIPTYNGERHLAEAIESVLAQTYDPFELLVVDDGSTDETRRIASAFSKVRLLAQKNAGVSVARNTGASAAQGTVLAFLDQDDEWTSHKLSVQVRPLVENPTIDYTLGYQQIYLDEGVPVPRWLEVWGVDRKHVGHFPGTLVVRLEAFECTGGFRPGTEPAEGADWFLRANECGLTKHVVSDVVLLKRIHDANQSGDQDFVRRQVLEAIRHSLRRRREAQRE